MSKKLLSIVSLHWNRKKYSTQSLKSVVERTTVPHEIILVDNNSKEEGLVDFLEDFSGNKHTVSKTLVRNPYNMGVAGGRNEGLRIAKGDVIAVIDDDLYVPTNWDKLIMQAAQVPKIGIIGINVEPSNYPIKNIGGVSVRPKYEGNIGGICQAGRREMFFDEKKGVGFFEWFDGIYYSMEDALNHVKLKKLGLLGVYILPRGGHLDKDSDPDYRRAKTIAQTTKSPELKAFVKRKMEIQNGGKVYNPYKKFTPPKKDSGIVVYDDDMILGGRR